MPMNIEVPFNINWVTTKESLFLKIVSTAKTRCSTDQRSMATEMLSVSLEECSRTNSPHQWFHSQLCYQIVTYFCRTLYLHSMYSNHITHPSTCLQTHKWWTTSKALGNKN
jgi:hypothetical protein